jgi:TPR repeat protein
LDSFFEPEQPKTGVGRIFLMVGLLAALGGAGWWTYTNYLGAAGSRKPQASASSAGQAPAKQLSAKPAAKDAAPTPPAGSSQTTVPSAAVPDDEGVPAGPAEPTKAVPETAHKTVERPAKPAAKAKPTTLAKREPKAAPAKALKLPAPAAADTGDAAFRKGEAYLYGRGVPKNCDQAVKNLKAASAKSNAKARSAFGTMYATGHCVPRDLPTSYLWFALALRVDPTNQILEKDLSAVWNQMTPPERQMATRMKQ